MSRRVPDRAPRRAIRRLLPLAIAVVVGLAGAGCAEDVSPAARIGDVKISHKALMDEIDEWTSNPAAFDPAQLASFTPGTYPMQLAGSILSQRIALEIHHLEFEALGLELDDDLRTAAIGDMFDGDLATARDALGGFSAAYEQRYIDAISEQFAVAEALGPEYVTWQTEAMAVADVEVSSRYGTWDGTSGRITPPEGPVQPAGGLYVEL